PGALVALDDEGAHARLVGVGMELEQAVPALLEHEGEGAELPPRSEPAEARAAPLDRGPEVRLELGAQRAVQAVGREDQVGRSAGRAAARGDVGQRLDLAAEAQLDAELPAALVEDLQQLHAREPAEAVARALDARVA